MMRSFSTNFLSVIAFIAFLVVVVSPTGASSFSVSKGAVAPAVSLAQIRFGEQRRNRRAFGKCGTKYGAWDSWITLRGGSVSPDNGTVTETKQTTMPFSGLSEAYYLVWSPKFLPKLALATTVLTVVRRFGWDHRLLGVFAGSFRSVPPGLLSNWLLPLLSSSCCAIQLAVNAFSVAVLGAGAGCLGFNTVLGPLRPYLMAVMLAYHTAFLPGIPSALFRYAFALMPEFVFGWNGLLRSRWRGTVVESSSASASTSATATAEPIRAMLIVEVPTMGCVACINKIESSLRACAPENIASASSWLNPKEEQTAAAKEAGKKGGRAQIEIQASSRDELNDLTKRLVGAIEDAGFKGSAVQTLDIQS